MIGLDASATADWIVEVIEQTSTNGSAGPAVYAAETLLDIAPARALALLKQSWPRHIRKWSDDGDGWRLMVAGAANRRLGRKNRAYALYRLALEVHYNKGMKAMCREALDALRPEADAPHRRRKRSAWSSGPGGQHGNEAAHRTT
ncbi:MAG: hypothetical protein AAFU77_16430 [Myxococcota bacterium]